MHQPIMELLRPIVQLHLVKLASDDCTMMPFEYITKATKNILQDMCLEIMNTVSVHVHKEFQQSLAQKSDLHLTQSPSKSGRRASVSDAVGGENLNIPKYG